MKSKNIWLKAGGSNNGFCNGNRCFITQRINSGNVGTVYAQEADTYSQVPSAVNVVDATTVWKYLNDNTDPASGLDSLTA